MRLWCKDLIKYLPYRQLLSQYRECCCIAKSIHDKGTPNHILVNKIMDYPIEHFYTYSFYIMTEMIQRGYKCNWNRFEKWFDKIPNHLVNFMELFKDWHDERYLKQCLFNLEEKALCQGIPKNEWDIIYNRFKGDYDLCQIK